MLGFDVERAHRTGLRCRPVRETVADTWEWLSTLTGEIPVRSELPSTGIDRDRERRVLEEWHARAG